MPSTIEHSSYSVAHELTSLDDTTSAVRDAKKRVLRDLTVSRVWTELIGRGAILIAADERPASLLRRVEFEYGEDDRVEPVAYRDAEADDPLSW
jgi:hypothetical protein